MIRELHATSPRTAVRRACPWLVLVWVLLGCARSHTASSTAETTPVKEKGVPIKLGLIAGPKGNERRPVYYMVRELTERDGFALGYDAALSMALQSEPDSTVLRQGLVYPGESRSLDLRVTEGADLALYVFFTNRSSAWKVLLPSPHQAQLGFVIEERAIRRAADVGEKR